MAVIFTVRAMSAPTVAPMTTPTRIQAKLTISQCSSVAPTATSMPVAPSMLPLRAVAGELSRFRPRMKRTAASRYAIWMKVGTNPAGRVWTSFIIRPPAGGGTSGACGR
jgi:hypothetical protein